MTTEQVSTDPIELRYTLTSDDLRDAVVAQLRGGWHRRVVALLLLAPVVGLAIGLARSRVWDLPADAFPIMAIVGLVLVLLGVGLGLLLNRLLLGWYHRWHVRLIMRGNPWLTQPIRTTVSATEVHVRNAAGESRSFWTQHPLYVETERSFVLLASKGMGAMALVLPKRGLAGEDPARLRALLDTHSRRRS